MCPGTELLTRGFSGRTSSPSDSKDLERLEDSEASEGSNRVAEIDLCTHFIPRIVRASTLTSQSTRAVFLQALDGGLEEIVAKL